MQSLDDSWTITIFAHHAFFYIHPIHKWRIRFPTLSRLSSNFSRCYTYPITAVYDDQHVGVPVDGHRTPHGPNACSALHLSQLSQTVFWRHCPYNSITKIARNIWCKGDWICLPVFIHKINFLLVFITISAVCVQIYNMVLYVLQF